MADYNIDYPSPDDIATQLEEQLRYGYKPEYREEIVFNSGTDTYDLACPGESTKKVYDIMQVEGTLDGTRYTFIQNIDYTLYDSDSDGYFDQISWAVAGDDPDDGTKFYVDYRYITEASGLTDFSAGSLTRTIFIEAPSLMLYDIWRSLNDTARNSFIDSASGRELDELGRIVSVVRNEATRTTGYVTLTRPANLTSGVISIPVGARISTTGSSVQPAVEFETIVTSEIANGATPAKVSDSEHDDYQKQWIAVQSVIPGEPNNVSASSIIRNVSVSSVVTTINNPPTFDTSDEELTGTGTKQVFILKHTADTNGFVDKDSDGKAIEVTNEQSYGWLDQPASSNVIDITVSSAWSGRATVYGNDGTYDISETEVFDASSNETTTSSFRWVYYITFTSDTETGIGDRTVTIESGVAGTDLLTTWGGSGKNVTRVDGGWTALNALDEHSYFSLSDITFTASDSSINTAAGDFTTEDIEVGDYITVSGSASNDGTYSVLTVGVPDAKKIVVNESITDESSGPTVVIKETTNITVYMDTGSGWVEETDGDWTRQTANVGFDTARTWMKYATGPSGWLTDHGTDSTVGQKNVKFEYVPESDMHDVSGNSAEFEYPPASDSILKVDYTFDNLFQDGADTETDDSYRSRIQSGVTASAKGTLDAIRSAVLAIDGVVGCTVDDHSTDATIDIGKIEVYAWGASGLLTAAKKAEVNTTVEETRAAGIQATVSSPTPMYFAVTITVYVASDSGYSTATVESNCEAAISSWLTGHTISEDLKKSDLVAALEAISGVYFVDIDTMTIKGYDQVTSANPSTDPPYTSDWDWTTTWPDGSGNIIILPTGYIAKPDTTPPNIIDVTASYYST